MDKYDWSFKREPMGTGGVAYICGFCGTKVADDWAYVGNPITRGGPPAMVVVCPHCTLPTFLDRVNKIQVPGD